MSRGGRGSHLAVFAGVAGLSAVVSGLAVEHALRYPSATDFALVQANARQLFNPARCIYNPTDQAAAVHALAGASSDHVLVAQFIDPATVPLVLWPLSPLPLTAALSIMLLLSAVAAGLAARELSRPLADRPQLRLSVCLAATASAPAVTTLLLGQVEALLLLAAVAGATRLAHRHDLSAGVLLGVLLIKPQLIWIVGLVLLFTWRPRALLGMILSGVTIVATALPFVRTSACARAWYESLDSSGVSVGVPDIVIRALNSNAIWLASTVAIGLAAVVLIVWLSRRRVLDDRDLIGLCLAAALVASAHSLPYDELLLTLPLMRIGLRWPMIAILLGVGLSAAYELDGNWPGPGTPVVLVTVPMIVAVAVVEVVHLLRTAPPRTPATA